MTPLPSKATRACAIALLALFLVSGLATPAVAQSSSDTSEEDSPMDFLCEKTDKYGNTIEPGEPGYSQAEYKHDVVKLLQNVIGVFMVAGPVGGTVVGLYATVAGVLQPGGDEGNNYTKVRRNSMLLGFGVPIFAVGYKVLSNAILPYDTGCIVPPLGI